jgi:peptidoglycan/xylan/chitin deacetylase (PgdA/CDA1 family)
MRRFLLLFVTVILLSACLPQKTQISEIPHERYTQAAKTVFVQLTQNALLTPSVTPTNTPEPTATITNTPSPSPTIPTQTPTWSFQEKGEIVAPILVYYNISKGPEDDPDYDPESQYTITPEVFQQQLMALKSKGYESIPVSLLTDAILFGTVIPHRPILITFDSTTEGIYNNAFPIMQEIGFIGLLFLTVNQINQEGMLTEGQITEMISAGWQIGSRGMNGYNLTSNYDYLSYEISGSKSSLEEMFGVPVTVFAYPYGKTDDMITPRVSSWGYQAAMGLTWYQNSKHTNQSLFYMSRFEVLNGEEVDQILADLPWQ